MQEKKIKRPLSVSILDEHVERIESRTDHVSGDSRSAQLVADLESYWGILDAGLYRARKHLTRREASLVLDTLNGSWFGRGTEAAQWAQGSLTHNVSDAIALDHAHEKWSVDGQSLLRRLEAIGELARLALADWARRMWSRCDDADLWTSEIEAFLPDPTPELTDEERLALVQKRLG